MPTIRKRGAKWQAQVRLKQSGVIVFSESATFDTEREAKRWANALEDRVLRDGVEAHYTQSTNINALARAWLQYKEKVKPLSRGMSHSYKAIITAPFAAKPLVAVGAQDYMAWAMSMKDRLDPATVMHHFMVLRSIFAHTPALAGFKPSTTALDAAMDTLKRSRVVAKSKSRDRRISDEELGQIVLHFKQQSQRVIPMDDYVRLAVYLPRRREELLTMQWADYTGDIVRLRDTKHPTITRDEIVPVPEKARAIIDRQPRFPGEGRILPYKPESVSAAFQRAVRAVGLADIRLHDLRHEGISRLFEAGLEIPEVALISGHVSWNALRRYTHLTPQNVLEKLNARSQAAPKAAP